MVRDCCSGSRHAVARDLHPFQASSLATHISHRPRTRVPNMLMTPVMVDALPPPVQPDVHGGYVWAQRPHHCLSVQVRQAVVGGARALVCGSCLWQRALAPAQAPGCRCSPGLCLAVPRPSGMSRVGATRCLARSPPRRILTCMCLCMLCTAAPDPIDTRRLQGSALPALGHMPYYSGSACTPSARAGATGKPGLPPPASGMCCNGARFTTSRQNASSALATAGNTI